MGEIHPIIKNYLIKKFICFGTKLGLYQNHNLKSKIRIYKDYSISYNHKDLSLTLEQDINFNDLKLYKWI